MKAVHPLNRGATHAANDDFYASHPEMVVSGQRQPIDPADPKQARLRQDWMKCYARHGGAVEPALGQHGAHALRKTHHSLRSIAPSVNRSAVIACPLAAKATPPAIKPPPQPPRKPSPKTPCKLVKLDIACQHGRHAGSDGILMVVPGVDMASTFGDQINGLMSFEGGCGDHAAWSVGGFWTSEGKGRAFNFKAQSATAAATGFFGLQNVSPHTYRVTGDACSGGKTIDVQAYPSGKISGKIDATKIKHKIHDLFKYIPIEKAKLADFESKFLVGAIKYEGSWNENHDDWRAYYERKISGGFDPFLSGSVKLPIYPPSAIPQQISKYIAAGVFFEITASGSFTLAYVSKYWPDTGKASASTWNVSIEGGVEVALSLEATLFNEDVLSAKVAGVTAGKIVAKNENLGEPIVKFTAKWEGFVAKFTVRIEWGIVSMELNREYQLIGANEWSLGEWHLGDSAEGQE